MRGSLMVFAMGILLVMGVWGSAFWAESLSQATFVEDFSTTSYLDSENTTASWDTVDQMVESGSWIGKTLMIPQDYIMVHSAVDSIGNFVLVYPQDDGAGYMHYNIYYQKYNSHGEKQGDAIRVNTNYEFNDNYTLDVAMNENGDFAVVWQNGQEYSGNENVILQVVDDSGNLIGQEIVEPFGGDGTENVEVAIDGNNVVVAWCDCFPGFLKIARYVINKGSNTVAKLGETITVYTARSLEWGNPIGVDISNGRIIAAYMDGSGIYIKCYNFGDGSIYIPQTQIDDASVQRNSIEIQINNTGDIVAGWVPYTGNNSELYVQRINSYGTLNGDKIKINQGSDGYIDDVNLMMSDSGNFVVVWYNNGQDAGVNGIFARKYFVNEGLGEISRVDSDCEGFQQYPTASMDNNEDVVCAWYYWNGGGSPCQSGVHGQRYDSNNNKLWDNKSFFSSSIVQSLSVISDSVMALTLAATDSTPANTNIAYYVGNGAGSFVTASYYNPEATGGEDFIEDAYGQSFVPMYESFDYVKLHFRGGWTDIYTVNIYENETDFQNGANPIASTTAYSGDPTTSSFKPIVFDFSEPVNVALGQTYYIGLQVEFNFYGFAVQYDSSGTYQDGMYYNSGIPNPSLDLNFEVGAHYTWEEVENGVLHIFSQIGSDVRWKAELRTTEPNITPTISRIAISSAVPRPSVSLYLPGREGVPLNKARSVPVFVSDVTGKGFTSLQTVLTYDGSIIHPLGVLTDGTMTEGWDVEFNVVPGTSPDTLKIAMATAQDTLSGSGTLFTVNVAAAEGASVGDSTILHFESFRFNEDTTAVDTQDGMVYIVPPERLLGDVTNNGVVTAYDAAHVLRHTIGLLTLTGDDSIAAEVSGDITISAYDASLVLQYVVRKISRFPVEEGQQAKVAYATRTVWMGEMETLPDGRMCLPIQIDEMDGVVAGELTLSFSGDAADVAVSTSALTSGYLLASNVREGRIRASFAGAESSTGPGPVLEMVFDASDTALLNSLRLERVSLNEGRIPVRIEGVESETPRAYRLSQNYPNPFNPETTIRYDVAKTGAVRLPIYALTGQLVRILVDEERPAGSYSVTWDGRDDTGRDVASGVYLCRMVAGDYSAARKLLLMK